MEMGKEGVAKGKCLLLTLFSGCRSLWMCCAIFLSIFGWELWWVIAHLVFVFVPFFCCLLCFFLFFVWVWHPCGRFMLSRVTNPHTFCAAWRGNSILPALLVLFEIYSSGLGLGRGGRREVRGAHQLYGGEGVHPKSEFLSSIFYLYSTSCDCSPFSMGSRGARSSGGDHPNSGRVGTNSFSLYAVSIWAQTRTSLRILVVLFSLIG